ncbi:MAG: TraR/DksA family transcriptional regulator [Chitinophagia bacterium]|nr:TraR/DksA family transcriptional regulator [Chitinophagia bacterium]
MKKTTKSSADVQPEAPLKEKAPKKATAKPAEVVAVPETPAPAPKKAKKEVAEPVVALPEPEPVKEKPARKKAVVEEPVEEAPVAKKAPEAKKPKAEAAPAAAPEKPVRAKREPAQPARKVLPESSLDKRAVAARAAATTQLPRPTATPAARPIEKKPQVVIAHRKLENKARQNSDTQPDAPYQPEVYRSILDEPVIAPITKYRYSDEELQEFKELIQGRLEAARKELAYLQGVITRKDEAGTEDTENRYMNVEDGSGAMEREQLAQLAGRQIQFVNHLEKALIRIENKTYGVCRVTGKLIEKARLRAVPHATLSIEAKKMMSSKQG